MIQSRTFRYSDFGLLALLSAIFCARNWLVLGSFWGDSARSIFEFFRAAQGEMPYRDYSFPYPPLSVALFGTGMRWMGLTFRSVQILMDLTSILCVFSVWRLTVRLMPRLTALIVSLAFIAVVANSGKGLALFSMDIYTPSSLLGLTGIVLLCIGFVDMTREGRLSLAASAYLAGGALMGLLSKVETAFTVVAAFLCVALLHVLQKRGRILVDLALVAAILFIPSAFIYLGIFYWLGSTPVLAGLSSYAMATMVCPWWPTGLGLCAVVSSLGGAIASIAIVNAMLPKQEVDRKAVRIRQAAIGLAGAVCWITFSTIFYKQITYLQKIQGPMGVINFTVSLGTLSTLIVWASIALFVREVLLLRRGAARSSEDDLFLIFNGIISALALRGLFQSPISHFPENPAVLQGFTVPVAPFLLPLFLRRWNAIWKSSAPSTGSARIGMGMAVLLVLLGVVRVVGAGVKGAPTNVLLTRAGAVKVDTRSAEVYNFVSRTGAAAGGVADFAYGGGLNFALHSPNPLFTTQFVNFRPTPQQRQRDLLQLESHEPTVAIRLGPDSVYYGSGVGCAFPAIKWTAPPCASNASETFPAVQYVDTHYYRCRRFGDLTVLTKTQSECIGR